MAPRVNAGAGGAFPLASGSLNTELIGTGSRAQLIDSDNFRMNASASYVTGTHNFKIGYDGAVISAGPVQPGQRPADDVQLHAAERSTSATPS